MFALIYVYILNSRFIFVYFNVSVRMFVVVFKFLFHRRLLVLSLEPCPSTSALLYALCFCERINRWID